MSFVPVYLDSSAILKLILREAEAAALKSALARWPDWLSSELAAVECYRAVRRRGENAVLHRRVQHVLASCTLIRLDPALMQLAEHVGPPMIRSLDAIHLAAALSIGDYPEAFVTYDDRLAEAARTLDLTVLQPGR
jgi:predicted nucleic acid-binding protein